LGYQLFAQEHKQQGMKERWQVQNCVSPTNKGFFRNRDIVNLRRGSDAIIWSTSISNPPKNIRKRNPKSARKSRIRKLVSSRFPNKNLAAIKPNIISTITDGIFLV